MTEWTGPGAPRVALFVTCLVNLMRPQIAEGSLELLEKAGAEVVVPLDQTCCGQPAFNAGDAKGGLAMARAQIAILEGYDYVVVPSGSCASTIAHQYVESFAGDPVFEPRARKLAERTHEITSFLVDVMGYRPEPTRLAATATYHDTCSGLREMGVHDQPRALLAAIEGLEMRPLANANVCCGFGGTFCVKYPDISTRMVSDKCNDIAATGAGTLLAGDLGCLLNMAGRLKREGNAVKVRHVAEVLAGMTGAVAPIGEGSAS